MPPTTSTSGSDELAESIKARLRVAVTGYRLTSILGRGGQATVYKAIDKASGNAVAIKLLHGGPLADLSAQRRFHREISVLKSLNHPNIVCFIASGQTTDGHNYLVMNYVEGHSLDRLWQDNPSSTSEADRLERLKLFIKICRVVGIAHSVGITHRDLSPSNIRIDSDGKPHILDFGLARSTLEPRARSHAMMTVTGQFVGKAAYASPEQALGKTDQISARSDVYSLGIILYQLLTNGRYPYEVRGDLLSVLRNIVETKPLPPNKLTHLPLDRALDLIALKAIEKDDQRRYESASELAQAVEDFISCRPVKTWASQSTNAKTLSLIAVIVFVAMAGGAFLRNYHFTRATHGTGALNSAPYSYPERVFAGHTDKVASVLLVPGTDILITGGESMFGVKEGISRANVYYPGSDNTVRFWDLRSGRQTGIIPTGLGPRITWAVTGLAVSSDGSRLAVTTGRFSDSATSVWQITTKRRLNYFPMDVGYGAFAPCFSSDDQELMVFQGDTTMRTYNLAQSTETKAQKWDVSASNPDMRVLCTTLDHKFLIGARANFRISLWSTADGRLVREFKGHTDIIRGLTLSQDNRLLASCSNDGTVRVWCMDTGVQKAVLLPGGDVRAVSFVGFSDRLVVSAGDDRIATLWNLDNALPLHKFIGHTDTIGCLCVSHDGHLLITGSEDKTVRSWNILSLDPVAHRARN